ncbi:MAG TPA: hypothetical protein VGY57_10465, partial [Vicinamibacterales bacterium]|nr:hypothetical protein [Vicinamibacterales bacterium]
AKGASATWGLAIVMVPGFWLSLQSSLPEPIAAVLVLAGYWCFLNGWLSWAGAAFAASLLIRETGAVFVFCLAGAVWMSGRRAEAVRFTVIALAPIALWRLYIAWILFPDMGSQALLFHPDDLGLPLGGIMELWTRIQRGEYFTGASSLARAGLAYPLLLVGAFALTLGVACSAPSAVSVAAVVYAVIAISLNYSSIWVHVGNAQRGTFETFLLLALVSIGMRAYSRAIRAALIAFWIGAAVYIFFGSFDSEYIRDAVFQGVL